MEVVGGVAGEAELHDGILERFARDFAAGGFEGFFGIRRFGIGVGVIGSVGEIGGFIIVELFEELRVANLGVGLALCACSTATDTACWCGISR